MYFKKKPPFFSYSFWSNFKLIQIVKCIIYFLYFEKKKRTLRNISPFFLKETHTHIILFTKKIIKKETLLKLGYYIIKRYFFSQFQFK